MEATVASLGMRDRIIIGLITIFLGGFGSVVTARTIDTRVAVLEHSVERIQPTSIDHRLTRIETIQGMMYRELTGKDLPNIP